MNGTKTENGSLTLYVRINMGRVRTNLSDADRQAYTLEETREWLVAAGFRPAPREFWAIAERDLGQLDPSEVTEVRTEQPAD